MGARASAVFRSLESAARYSACAFFAASCSARVSQGKVKRLRLRALAIPGPKRSPELPDVPTLIEAGYPNLTVGAWTALLAPKDTPPDIVAKLNAATNAALRSEAMATALAKLGTEPRGGTPQMLAEHMAREEKKWKPVVESLNLKAD